MEESRAAKHRRSSKAKWFIVAGLACSALIAAWLLTRPASPARDVVRQGAPASQAKSAAKDTYAVLVVADPKKDSRLVTVALLASRSGASTTVGVAMSGLAFLNVPGRGPEPLAEAYEESPDYVISALSSLSGLRIKGYVVVDQQIYKRATSENELTLLFDRSVASDMDSHGLQQAADGFENSNNVIQEIHALPGRSTPIGSQTYYQIDEKSLAADMKAIWGAEAPADSGSARVIVLNGSGVPGAGTKAADLVMAAGLRIVDVRNADNFNYQKTLIYTYGSSAREAAEEAAKTLKVGDIVEKHTPQDITDIVVIVGADFGR